MVLNLLGFVPSQSDSSLFVHLGEYAIYILVYVDDMIITGSDKVKVGEVLAKLGEEFAVRELGELSYFLGIQVQNHLHGSS